MYLPSLPAPRNPAPNDEAKEVLSKHNRIDFDRLMQIHDEYNEAVRRVGAEVGALVVDMDRFYRPYEGEPVFLPTDVPHPAQGGHVLEAETLYSLLVRRGILRPAPRARAHLINPDRAGGPNSARDQGAKSQP